MQQDLETSVLRKITRRIVPLIVVLYFVSFLDRVNIGFAALTMNKDLGLTPAMFGFGGGVFFLGYFIFEVPSNLILHRVGARIWIARVAITWGVISGATAFVRGPVSFYWLRFLLGLAEAGFFPGIILYLSYWFPARRRAAVTAAFMAAAPISGLIGSPVSGALLGINGVLGLKGWQWVFLLEAAPAVVLGFVTLACMTDRPERATWLASEEREWLVHKLAVEERGVQVGGSQNTVWQALGSPHVLALAIVYFGLSMALYAVGLWMPQLIQGFGFSNQQVGWINSLPYVVATVGMLWWARHSDRTGERTWHIVIGCLAGAIGLGMAGSMGSARGAVIALSFGLLGISAARPPLWVLPKQFLSGPAAAAGIAFINAIGNLGGFVGPSVIGWLKGVTGKFAWGFAVIAASLVLSALVTLLIGRSRPCFSVTT